jgi:SAM-dependent methyltransferase
MTTARDWQLRLYEKTIKKKEKVQLLASLLPPLDGLRCLDLGCAQGTVSYMMRRLGGRWTSVDLDHSNVAATLGLVEEGVVQVGRRGLPFRDGAFDLVLALDFVEHVTDDGLCLDEVRRVLRPGGLLVLSAPSTYRGQTLNWLKCRIGMTPDVYGHMREGYSLEEMGAALEARGLEVVHRSTYSRFFTEAIELGLNVGYRLLKGGGRSSKRTGAITPSSEEELRSVAKTFKLYSRIYPLTLACSKLDVLVPFLRGYAILLCAFKPGPAAAAAAAAAAAPAAAAAAPRGEPAAAAH